MLVFLCLISNGGEVPSAEQSGQRWQDLLVDVLCKPKPIWPQPQVHHSFTWVVVKIVVPFWVP